MLANRPCLWTARDLPVVQHLDLPSNLEKDPLLAIQSQLLASNSNFFCIFLLIYLFYSCRLIICSNFSSIMASLTQGMALLFLLSSRSYIPYPNLRNMLLAWVNIRPSTLCNMPQSFSFSSPFNTSLVRPRTLLKSFNHLNSSAL